MKRKVWAEALRLQSYDVIALRLHVCQGKGGTSVPHPEAHLRLRQGALPWTHEEPPPSVRLLRAGPTSASTANACSA